VGGIRGADRGTLRTARVGLRRRKLFAMHTIELSEEELQLLHSALHAYLDDFGHEEADVLRRIKALIAKLPDAE
jgi:hypothetical protein